MPNRQYEQHDFSVGEISPDHVWRAELQIRSRSLKAAINVRPTVGGAMAVRPGTTRLETLASSGGQIVDVTVADTTYALVFTAATLDVWNKATRTKLYHVEAMPWQLSDLPDAVVAPENDKTYVFHPNWAPRVITRASDGTWGVTTYAFATGIGSAVAQPHYRFAAPSVTITPSARTGSVTLTASSAYFVAGHVGLRLRLQGREVTIATRTDSTHATATVVQELYPTRTVTVASSSGFEIGEVITGADSTAKGEVTAIPSSTTLTVLMQTFTDFLYVGGGTPTTEKVIGRNAVTTTGAATSTTTDAAVLDWTEQAVSALRGWPGAGVVHRKRLFMGRLSAIPAGIIASAVGDYTDCEVGADDADAIFELLGDANAGVVQHFVSAEQLVVLTSRRAYYYPESEANPITPAGFGLLALSPIGATACRPAVTAEGVLFGGSGGGSLQLAYSTGDVRRSWRQAELSRLAAHMVKHPLCVAYVSGAEDADDADDDVLNRTLNFAYVVNTSESISIVSYSESEQDAVPGWARWQTTGRFKWAAATEGDCWAIVARDHGGVGEKYALEVFDAARLVDSACDVTSYQGVATTQTIATPNGVIPATRVYRCAELKGATCSLVIAGDYIGEVVVNSSGDFGVPANLGAIELGFGFEASCVPWPPMDAEDQRARRRKRRIIRAFARYQGKLLAINGTLRPSYDAGEDTAAAVPERDELWSQPAFGWSHEPTATFSRPYAAPWLLLGTVLEVAS